VPVFSAPSEKFNRAKPVPWAAVAWIGLILLILAGADGGSHGLRAAKLGDAHGEFTVSAWPSQSSDLQPQDPNAAKVAEGEYVMIEEGSSGAVGPAGEEIFNFHETWTLWRAGKGDFELTGERQYDSPRYLPHNEKFWVLLSRDLALVSVKEFAKLRWRPDSGPLGCDFQPENLHCNFGAKDPKNAFQLDIPIKNPCGFLWPVSPFSFRSVGHAAEKSRGTRSPVQLISMEQPGPQNPVNPKLMDGSIRYLGREEITAARQKWNADKFELHVATHPRLLMWLTREGILLVLSPEHTSENWPKEQLELTRYQKFRDF